MQKREINRDESLTKNFYPIDSAIAMRDKNDSKIQVTVMNDRPQSGSADLSDKAMIEIIQHRRLSQVDPKNGYDNVLNDTDKDGGYKGVRVNAEYNMQIFDTSKGKSLQRDQQIKTDQPLQYFFVFNQVQAAEIKPVVAKAAPVTPVVEASPSKAVPVTPVVEAVPDAQAQPVAEVVAPVNETAVPVAATTNETVVPVATPVATPVNQTTEPVASTDKIEPIQQAPATSPVTPVAASDKIEPVQATPENTVDTPVAVTPAPTTETATPIKAVASNEATPIKSIASNEATPTTESTQEESTVTAAPKSSTATEKSIL